MKRLLSTAAFALAVSIPAVGFAADYAPIDCARAASAADRTICGNYALGQAEARMATLYGIDMSLVAMGQRGDIGDAQKQWLKTREACGTNVACLTKSYNDRVGQLNKVIKDIASRGPY
ncbi:MAG: lysozyme inhibitor LprI family protein [Xanthobacteraceae bacterium]